MTRRLMLGTALLMALSGTLFAGDIATFVNLGFSQDSRIFMFGQYGIEHSTSRPFAELYVVDVPDNRFVRDGVRRRTFETPISPGQDGSGALYSLLTANAQLLTDHQIDPLKQGRLIYLLINAEAPTTEIDFRDFSDGTRYHVQLRQNRRGEGKSASAAFHLLLRVTSSDGRSREFTVGLPDFYREGVSSYQISQAFLSPDERSLVFVIERISDSGAGRTVRYMVETVRFR